MTFADEAEIVAQPGSDRVAGQRRRSTQASAGFGATRYRAALSAASQTLAGRHGTVVVVTDLQENGWDAGDRASVPEGTTIEVADVGAMPTNLAVTAVAAAGRSASSPPCTTAARARAMRACT